MTICMGKNEGILENLKVYINHRNIKRAAQIINEWKGSGLGKVLSDHLFWEIKNAISEIAKLGKTYPKEFLSRVGYYTNRLLDCVQLLEEVYKK